MPFEVRNTIKAVIVANIALVNFIVAKVGYFFIWLDLINKTLSLYGLRPFLVSWFLWATPVSGGLVI